MAIDKESSGVPEVDLSRRTTKVNLAMIAMIGLFIAAGVALAIYFSRGTSSENHGVQGPYLVAIPVIIAIPALYWLITRRSHGRSGGNRPDSTERTELTGTEQAKHREPR